MSVSLPFNVIISGVGLLLVGFAGRMVFHKLYKRQ